MVELQLMEVLSAGGDLATMLLLYVAWRFDKRVYRLEFIEEMRSGKSVSKQS